MSGNPALVPNLNVGDTECDNCESFPFFQLSSQLEVWASELAHTELSVDLPKAEQYLQSHNDSMTVMENRVAEETQSGNRLFQVCVIVVEKSYFFHGMFFLYIKTLR